MIEFNVEAMSCGHCASTITQTLQRVDPQAKVEVDLAAKKVRVESSADRALLAEALAKAGYPPAGAALS
jgi:copper chaperone